MEKPAKHRFLNNALFTALIVPLAFFVLRDTISILTELMFRSIGGEDSLLYQINDDIARLIIAGLLMLIMPIFFRGRCNFGFKGGFLKLGILLSLPELIVPLWNLLQIKVYDACRNDRRYCRYIPWHRTWSVRRGVLPRLYRVKPDAHLEG